MKYQPKLFPSILVSLLSILTINQRALPAQNSPLPTIARVTGMNQGDLACYVDLVDLDGQKYSSVYAIFEICEQPETFLNKTVRLSYQQENFNDCQSAEPCGQTRLETAITEMTLIAQSNRTRRIQFDRGATSSIVKDSVVRGTSDIYLVGALASQTMKISLSSLENNAVFDLVTPKGTIIKQEVTSVNLVLPLNGDYKIIVGGTRGNATYQLYVEINNTETTQTLRTKNFKITINSNCREGEVTCDNVSYEQ